MTEAFAHGDTIAIAIADGVGAVLVSDAGVTPRMVSNIWTAHGLRESPMLPSSILSHWMPATERA